ncbi:hypothetical protein [Bacteroides sp.]|uniref:HEAT repeat domain-containing protein n=1 Tax=Bacteroides sp. TaxID=29523 RepID=UPI0025C13B13|nr:hypothetical protein [Bacteroides sp.]
MIKRIVSLLILTGTITSVALAAKLQRGFAIVVDPVSYKEARTDIDNYAKAVENDGLKTYIIVDRWGVPDSIRFQLRQLYLQKECPIEGAVFVGDIPVPMIRDAQHLTSAFKMNQETFPRTESSVPSDRFYDDFDLKFNFLDKDEQYPLYYYYSLAPDSPQFLSPEIYSGRIKMSADDASKYDKLRAYLQKVVALKQNTNLADQLLYFSGQGYVSESMMARIDEKLALVENFPWTRIQQNGIEYIDHKRDAAVKYRLMSELQRNDLDIAILHHHGDVEIEYMNDLPEPQTTKDQVEGIKLYLRETMRHAREKGKNTDSIQLVLSKRFDDLPISWFEGSFDPEMTKKDSLFLRSLDLYIEDFDNYTPNARFIVLDACFNGSYHKDKYIAGAYISGKGNTMAVLANSVNVLQEKWTDRYLGLVGLGMRVGRMAMENPYLEGHLIGDPTFHFTTPVSLGFDINEVLSTKNATWWKKLLNSSYPALQAMALRKLSDGGQMNSGQLLDKFMSSPSDIVRMECLVLLSEYDDDNFIRCLDLAVSDSYEMIQRFAINMIARNGDDRLIPALIRAAIRNNTAERIEFNVKQALALFPEKELTAEFQKQFNPVLYVESEKAEKGIKRAIEVNSNRWLKDISSIYADDSLTVNQRLGRIRYLRNYNVHSQVPQLLEYLQKTDNEPVQISLLEALGWFRMSCRHDEISQVVQAMSQDSHYSQAVRDEALKTYNRIMNHRK